MEELLPILVGVVVVVAGLIAAVSWISGSSQRQLEHRPAAAIGEGDEWYRQALRLARLLERIRNDDMIRVTFPEPLTKEVDSALRRFWADVDPDD